jgi:hypothetical protein
LKERLLVLAKAAPEVSKKYSETVCVAGITDSGEWRRIYPVPWETFWQMNNSRFKKKWWIEYDVPNPTPSDHRPESRKIDFDTIRPLGEEKYATIEKMLKEKLSSIEDLEEKGPKNVSLGVVKPLRVKDFVPTSNSHYEDLVTRKAQRDILGKPLIKLEIPAYKYRYLFMDDEDGREHEMLCEDWEVGELYRKCENDRKAGKYDGDDTVHSHVKDSFLDRMFLPIKRDHVYFIVGSHSRYPTYMVVGVVYPRMDDIRSMKMASLSNFK